MSNPKLIDQNSMQLRPDALEHYFTELFAKAEFSPTLEEGVHHLNALFYDPGDKDHVYDVLRVCMAQMVVAFDEGDVFVLDSKVEQNFKVMMAAVYMNLKEMTAEKAPHLVN